MEKHLLGKFSDFRVFQASRAALRMIQFNAEEPAIRNSFQKKDPQFPAVSSHSAGTCQHFCLAWQGVPAFSPTPAQVLTVNL